MRAHITVVANGTPVEVPENASVEDLLHLLELGGRWVLVERNGEPVPRDQLGSTRLDEGDRLELVRAVAGG
ncbi:MAG TPA: sulfur carrier protein ThiS [Acidimicrobiales bacterium]|nr:sulfur carrier protein ThiS [Acidimicrobiales bacterium]